MVSAERKASRSGLDRVVLLTTRTADWFEQRGFQAAGNAHSSFLLPETRRVKVRSPPLLEAFKLGNLGTLKTFSGMLHSSFLCAGVQPPRGDPTRWAFLVLVL